MDSIILAPIALADVVANGAIEFAQDHPVAAVAIGTVVVGLAAYKGYELSRPYVAPVAVQLNEWRKDAQALVADTIRPNDRPVVYALSAPAAA